jgi:mediator of RNA polymerase II transcription subunit 10
MIQVSAYDLAGKPGKDVLENAMYVPIWPDYPTQYCSQVIAKFSSPISKQLHRSLQKVHTTASAPDSRLPNIPPELIQYVDNGRNPDIYTREFVELARKGNQLMKGKMAAFGDFRNVLAGEMARTLPELREDIGTVLDDTGGGKETILKQEEWSSMWQTVSHPFI